MTSTRSRLGWLAGLIIASAGIYAITKPVPATPNHHIGDAIGGERSHVGLPEEHEVVRNAPRDADGFLLEPPDDGLHRLSRMGLKEDGERKWIVPLKMYDQPSVRRKWDVAPPEDLLVYTGPKDPMKQHAFNEKVSNQKKSDRKVPDTRSQSCRWHKYDQDLPSTSVILCFHNEARSTLLRTVRSVINRTPPHLLVEIILVDDASDWPIPEDILAMEKVKGVLLESREGLIRARTVGAQVARGEVLTFLDSHCEANEAWVQPLLQRIKQDYKTVVTPVIDLIDDSSFKYTPSPLVRGGFNWGLTFKWKPISRKEKRESDADPVSSPTMAGGLFAIHRKWFLELGTYDLGMDIWGGENLEMSFRIWQCGGRLEIMPCSRVGHVFRKRHPYTFPGGGVGNIFLKNTLRAARVWMGEYIKLFYDTRGGNTQSVDSGDLTERVALREELQCKPFKWYLTEIFPELRVPETEALFWGELKTWGDMCFDSLSKDAGNPVGMYGCHGQGGNQAWTLTKGNELRHDEACVDADPRRAGHSKPAMLRACDEDEVKLSQLWEYTEEGQLWNAASDTCLDRGKGHSGSFVMVVKCDAKEKGQIWTFSRSLGDKDASNAGEKGA